MSWYGKLRMVPKIVLPVGTLLVVALGLLTWQIQARSTEALVAASERELTALAGRYGNEVRLLLEASFTNSRSLAEAVAATLEQNHVPSREILATILYGSQRSNDLFVGTGAIWEPNAYDNSDSSYKNGIGSDANGRFLPYNAIGTTNIVALSGFENTDYYTNTKTNNSPYLSEPYTFLLGGKQTLISTATAPVKVNGVTRGIILTDVLLQGLDNMVDTIKVYDTGYGGLLTQTGTIVAHPQKDIIGKNLFEMGRSSNSAEMQNAVKSGKPYMTVIDGKEFCYFIPLNLSSGQVWYFAISAPVDEVVAEARFISNLTIAMSGAVTVLVLLLIFVVVRSSVKPMAYLATVAEDIARGNLNVVIHDADFGGEVGQLSTSMKAMVSSLVENITKAEAMSQDAQRQAAQAQEAMQQAEAASREAEAKRDGMLRAADKLEEVSGILSSASEQLSAQIRQSERGASEQAQRVTETVAAMEEMNSTVLEVAKNAGEASDVSATTRDRAENGARVVQKAVDSIRGVRDQSLVLKDGMTALSEHAQSISRIMNVISDIADQTNLLALNAAIEAARAGEAGRGFAVVADEVRKLAEKTMASTTDVGNAIRAIQQAVTQNITQVDTAVQTIEQATELSNSSGVALGEIVTLVDQTADQVRAIATASEQQSATSEEITRAVTQVNVIASETAQSMQEAAHAVSELAGQAHVLSQLIDDMKK